MRNSDRGLLGPLLQYGGAITKNGFPCSLALRGEELLPYMGWGQGYVQGLGWRDGLGGLSPFSVVCVQGACAVSCFCSQVFRSGSWVFGLCCILCIIYPSCTQRQLFLYLIVSLCFVAWEDAWTGASIAVKGPTSQVPACLMSFHSPFVFP